MNNTINTKISLNEKEQQIFDLLLQVVKDNNLFVTLRAAGGWVRDKLLGDSSQDIDITVDLISGQQFAKFVLDWMKSHNLPVEHLPAVVKQNPDKSKHLETTILSIYGVPVDFVQIRNETYNEESRIPQIQTNVSVEDDALRRDFTVNALFYNLRTKEVEDFTGQGLQDLRQGILRTPRNSIVTFLQDPLRILRAIRFACKYDFKVSKDIVSAANDFSVREAFQDKLSAERIWKEMIGTEQNGRISGFLLDYNPYRAASLMDEFGIVDLIFGPLNKSNRDILDNFIYLDQLHLLYIDREIGDKFTSGRITNDTIQTLCVFLWHSENPETVLQKLKAPNEIIKRVCKILNNKKRYNYEFLSNKELRRILRDLTTDWNTLLLLTIVNDENEEHKQRYLDYRDRTLALKKQQNGEYKIVRPIDGITIMTEFNICGPLLGKAIERLDEGLLENPNMTTEEAIQFLRINCL